MRIDERRETSVELLGGREELLKLLLALLFLIFAVRLRLNLEEHHMKRAIHLLRNRRTAVGETLGNVANECSMKIVFEVWIFEALSDTESILDTALRNDLEERIELRIVRLWLELQEMPKRLVFGHDDRLMKHLRG